VSRVRTPVLELSGLKPVSHEANQGDEKVAPLVRQLPWTHNLVILGQSKRREEREFYPRLAIQERWSRRERDSL
jgi:predicted nuclease of restriction endonuclease-like (RecB) superfamily